MGNDSGLKIFSALLLALSTLAPFAAAACTSTGTAVETPLTPPGRMYRIGYLTLGPSVGTGFPFREIEERLRELRYVEGENYLLEARYADGNAEALPALAAELVEARVDVIVVSTTAAVRAAKAATTTIPIVMTGSSSNPVLDGLVESYARPGGNITGMAAAPVEVGPKRLERLAAAVPSMSRVMVLGQPDSAIWPGMTEGHWDDAASALGIELVYADVRTGAELENSFRRALAARPQGVVVLQRAILSGPALPTIAELTAANNLPAIAASRAFAEAGGLMAYEERMSDRYRRVGDYIDRMLSGTDPASTPVENPSFYDSYINLRTARTIGIDIPASVLVEASGVLD